VLVDAIVAQAKERPEKAVPYTFPGELLRERCAGLVTRAEQAGEASRWARWDS